MDSEDSNREDHPLCDYGEESSPEEEEEEESDPEGSDVEVGGGLDTLRARVVRELEPHIGAEGARRAVGWDRRPPPGGGEFAWEGSDADRGESDEDEDVD